MVSLRHGFGRFNSFFFSTVSPTTSLTHIGAWGCGEWSRRAGVGRLCSAISWRGSAPVFFLNKKSRATVGRVEELLCELESGLANTGRVLVV